MTEARDPAVVARMEALVRDIAARHGKDHSHRFASVMDIIDEARAIVVLLPELVDPDLLMAREVMAKAYSSDEGSQPEHWYVVGAMEIIRRVREQERG